VRLPSVLSSDHDPTVAVLVRTGVLLDSEIARAGLTISLYAIMGPDRWDGAPAGASPRLSSRGVGSGAHSPDSTRRSSRASVSTTVCTSSADNDIRAALHEAS
jgi:hypothetical protein